MLIFEKNPIKSTLASKKQCSIKKDVYIIATKTGGSYEKRVNVKTKLIILNQHFRKDSDYCCYNYIFMKIVRADFDIIINLCSFFMKLNKHFQLYKKV